MDAAHGTTGQGRHRVSVDVRWARQASWLTFGTWMLLATTAYAAAHYTGPGWLNSGTVFNVIGASTVVAVVVGARALPSSRRLPWLFMAAGQMLFVVGDVIAYNYEGLFGDPLPFPSVADAFYLAYYPLLVAGFLMLLNARGGRDAGSVIDAVVITLGVAALSWVYLIAPYAHDASLGISTQLISIAYPLMDLLVLGVLVRLVVVSDRGISVSSLLAGAAAVLFIVDSVYGWKLLHGGYQTGSLLDVGWAASYMLLGVAALHPVAREPQVIADVSTLKPGVTRTRFVFLAAATLVAPAILLISPSADSRTLDIRVLAAISVVMFGLVLTRMLGLLRGREEAMSGLRFRSMFEHSVDIVAIVDERGSFTYLSPSMEPTLGFGSEEMLGQSAFSLLHPDDHDRVLATFADGVSRGKGATATMQYRCQHEDGSWRTFETVAMNMLPDPAVHGVVLVSRDITERLALESQLEQTRRLEGIGQFAGGVAHDFNNILMVITGFSSFLEPALKDKPREQGHLREILAAAARGTVLSRKLLTVGRREIAQPTVLEMNAVVRDMEAFLRRVLPEDISLTIHTAATPLRVLADLGQIEQVLLNLVANARDATPAGGAVEITLGEIDTHDSGVASTPSLAAGRYFVMSVIDTGSGIDSETESHLFEPFYTTKPLGQGTGLGLATVYAIIAEAGGGIAVDSTLGEGTTFSIYLPESAGGPPASPGVKADTPILDGTETILLVENDLQVRTVMSLDLSARGYRIIPAASPADALVLAETHRSEISLLLSDIVMPGMSGHDLAKRLLADQPQLHCLFVSGHPAAGIRSESIGLPPDIQLLQKPFSPDKLAAAVRDALDRRPSTPAHRSSAHADN